MKRLLTTLATGLLLSTNAANASYYVIEEVIPISGTREYVANIYDINDARQIAGLSYRPLSEGKIPKAVIWNNGIPEWIDETAPRWSASGAYAINDYGQTAGFFRLNNAMSAIDVPAAWQDDDLTELPNPSYQRGYAYDINNAGKIVGFLSGSDDKAALWDGGSLTILDPNPLKAGFSTANAINESNQVAGKAEFFIKGERYYHATLWENGSMHDLGSLYGGNSFATDINEAGIIVGISDSSYAFKWDGSSMIDIHSSLWKRSQASAVNDLGQIVGNATPLSDPGYFHAILWNEGGAIDLNDVVDPSITAAGWVLWVAIDINNHGDIIGYAKNRFTGEVLPYLLTISDTPQTDPFPAPLPVPEPHTYLMLLVGIGFVVSRFKSMS